MVDTVFKIGRFDFWKLPSVCVCVFSDVIQIHCNTVDVIQIPKCWVFATIKIFWGIPSGGRLFPINRKFVSVFYFRWDRSIVLTPPKFNIEPEKNWFGRCSSSFGVVFKKVPAVNFCGV